MKCKRPMAHRPAMEGVINCKACEREEKERMADVEKEISEYVKNYLEMNPHWRNR